MTDADIRHSLIVYEIPTAKAKVATSGPIRRCNEAYAESAGEMRGRTPRHRARRADSLETVYAISPGTSN